MLRVPPGAQCCPEIVNLSPSIPDDGDVDMIGDGFGGRVDDTLGDELNKNPGRTIQPLAKMTAFGEI
jgi:hypothetical protein